MDTNTHTLVAPLTGSVDRNGNMDRIRRTENGSLPSRGAWIEIVCIGNALGTVRVAPLTGSVDRNRLM